MCPLRLCKQELLLQLSFTPWSWNSFWIWAISFQGDDRDGSWDGACAWWGWEFEPGMSVLVGRLLSWTCLLVCSSQDCCCPKCRVRCAHLDQHWGWAPWHPHGVLFSLGIWWLKCSTAPKLPCFFFFINMKQKASAVMKPRGDITTLCLVWKMIFFFSVVCVCCKELGGKVPERSETLAKEIFLS